MTSIAQFTVPAADFPLGRVFEDRPGATFELDRVVPSGDTFMPYFWVHDPDLEGVLAVFERLPELRSAVLMEDLGDRGLFRAEWNPEYGGVMHAIAESGVTVLSATGSADGWVFELRAGASGSLSAFQGYCDEHGVNATLTHLSRVTDAADATGFGLTPDQREALVLAYEEGYYDEPRRTDLDELATRLGISRQAFSSRLRRGYRNFVGTALVPEESSGG